MVVFRSDLSTDNCNSGSPIILDQSIRISNILEAPGGTQGSGTTVGQHYPISVWDQYL